MKILIMRNGKELKIYHHPRDVQIDLIKKIAYVGSEDMEEYDLASPPELKFIRCEASGFDEVMVKLEVL